MASRLFLAFFFSIAGLGISSTSSAQNILANPGFEIDSYGSDLPQSFDQWSGDLADLVGAEQGVTPAEGSAMLRFLATEVAGPAAASISCDVLQLRSLASWLPSIRAGSVSVRVDAKVNRVAGASVDSQFWLEVWAMRGAPEDFPSNLGSPLGTAQVSLDSDANPVTWETLEAALDLHPLTDYVAVYLYAVENVVNDGPPNQEFDGHYADDVSLQLEGAVSSGSTRFGAVKARFDG
ncbi:MAG: hypothetical protein HKO53_01540 [Gemmatimonadetes bacterium]|nr:hypothetical protein [Gemmatimonadota bacterium]